MPGSTPLGRNLTTSWLRAKAGKRVYDQGSAYYHANMVTDLIEGEAELSGTVEGRQLYRTQIRVDDGTLSYRCSCAEREQLCKHVVALGLTWLVRQDAKLTAVERFVGYTDLAALRDYLATLPQDTLLNLVLELAHSNETVLVSLLRGAISKGYGDELHIRQAISKLLRVDPTRPMGARYIHQLEEITTLVDTLAASGKNGSARRLRDELLHRIDPVVHESTERDSKLLAVVTRLREMPLAGDDQRGH